MLSTPETSVVPVTVSPPSAWKASSECTVGALLQSLAWWTTRAGGAVFLTLSSALLICSVPSSFPQTVPYEDVITPPRQLFTF